MNKFLGAVRESLVARTVYVVLVCALSVSSILAFLPRIEAHSDESQTQQKLTDQDTARKQYAEHVAKSFNFAFGPGNISTPGNAAVEGNTFLQPDAFPTAEYCGHCHKEAYHQWRQSLHSNSFRTPFYRTSVNILMRTKGIEFARHCDSCHNPVAVLGGGLTQSSVVDRSFDQDGLTCMTCHSVQKLQSTNGNGGYVMGVPAVLVDDKGTRLPGLVPDSEILAHLDRHSKAVMQPIYRTPEFCSACHKANLPNPLNDYKFIRAFTAYDEWQNSKFSQRNPLTFYQADFTSCQGCHMKRATAPLPEPGCEERHLCIASLACGQHGGAVLLRLR